MATSKQATRNYFTDLGLGKNPDGSGIYDPSSIVVYSLVIESGQSETEPFSVPPGARTAAILVPDTWNASGSIAFLSHTKLDATPWVLLKDWKGSPVTLPGPAQAQPGWRDITETGILSLMYVKVYSYNQGTSAAFNQTAWNEIEVLFK